MVWRKIYRRDGGTFGLILWVLGLIGFFLTARNFPGAYIASFLALWPSPIISIFYKNIVSDSGTLIVVSAVVSLIVNYLVGMLLGYIYEKVTEHEEKTDTSRYIPPEVTADEFKKSS